MNVTSFIILSAIIGYLTGSIPFALIIGKIFYKTDVRKYGSGNLGSTNVGRTLGPLAGSVVMILDILKGGLPPFIMYKIAEKVILTSHPEQLIHLSAIYCICAIFVALGHCYPIFANFKGGKAVASIAGFLLFMNYKLFIIAILSYVIVALITKIISLSSISSALSVMSVALLPFFKDGHLFKYNELHPTITNSYFAFIIYVITVLFLGHLLIFKHIPNIKRIIRKEEKKFKYGKLKKM